MPNYICNWSGNKKSAIHPNRVNDTVKTLITAFSPRLNSDTNVIIIADYFPIVNLFAKERCIGTYNQCFLGSLSATLVLLIIIIQAMRKPTAPPTMTPPKNINHPIKFLLFFEYEKGATEVTPLIIRYYELFALGFGFFILRIHKLNVCFRRISVNHNNIAGFCIP